MQVNQNRSISNFHSAAAADSPVSCAHDDRRAVKEIARNIDSDLKKLGREGDSSIDVEKLERIRNRAYVNREKLAALCEKDLDRSAPAQNVLSKARSAVVLGGGVAGRTCALAGASVAGIAELGFVAVAAPVIGALQGASIGAIDGSYVFGGYASPITVPVGAALGAAAGAVNWVAAAVIATPERLASKGSFTRNTFSVLDQYSKAKAHVARKNMSTRDIADTAALKANKALSKAQDQCAEAASLRRGPERVIGRGRNFSVVTTNSIG